MKKLLLLTIATLIMGSAFAATNMTYYVSSNTGSNPNNGTKDAPFKNIQKALDVAKHQELISNHYSLITIHRP